MFLKKNLRLSDEHSISLHWSELDQKDLYRLLRRQNRTSALSEIIIKTVITNFSQDTKGKLDKYFATRSPDTPLKMIDTISEFAIKKAFGREVSEEDSEMLYNAWHMAFEHGFTTPAFI